MKKYKGSFLTDLKRDININIYIYIKCVYSCIKYLYSNIYIQVY